MKIRLILASMLLMALVFACGNNNTASAGEKIEQEMMAEHDRIMPKMGELNELYKEMRIYLYEDSSLSEKTREDLSMVTANLQEANEAMMDWMNGISDLELNKVSMKPEELEKYLTTQKDEIFKIGKFTDENIEKAKEALKNRKK